MSAARSIFSVLLIIIGGAALASAQTNEGDRTDSHADQGSVKATVYLYRSLTKEQQAKNKVPVYSDEKPVASLADGRYVIVMLDPGSHTFQTGEKRAGAFRLALERGRKYYLRVTPLGAAGRRGFAIAQVDEKKGATEVGQLTPVETGDLKNREAGAEATP